MISLATTMSSVQEEHGLGKASFDISTAYLKEHLNDAGDDFAPKARKPYTITKQRERWSEEEHKKFLEALKLYGRAWRRIEDHVGTKTAVQIRSHAQKFFTKVAREPNIADADSAKPIEIPPPRPKRKPMHPYPRKLISQVKSGISVLEKYPNTMEMENQSPTSVLSAVGSDSSVGLDSFRPNGNPYDCSDMPKLTSEEREDENSSTNEHIPMELDLPSQDGVNFVKEVSNESATQSLKLFGQTLLVCEPFYSGPKIREPESSFHKSEENILLPWRTVPLKFPPSNSEYVWSRKLKCESKSPAPFPWLTLCSSCSNNSNDDALIVLNPEVVNPIPVKTQFLHEKKEKMDGNDKEGSTSSSSNTTTALVGGKNGKYFSSYKLSKRILADSSSCRKGFMPYKRCISEQNSTISSTESAEEREKQCVRLCL